MTTARAPTFRRFDHHDVELIGCLETEAGEQFAKVVPVLAGSDLPGRTAFKTGSTVRKLSIVIPAIGRLKSLEATLISVLENRPPDCEVMVVFNEPYDDPYDLAGEVRFVEAPHRAGPVDCINLGLQHADAPIIHLLSCGMEASDGWTDGIHPHFDDPRVASVSPLLLNARDHRRVMCAGIGYGCSGVRKSYRRERTLESAHAAPWLVGPSLAAGFYRKSIVVQEGLRPDASVGEQFVDVDWGLRLRQAGYVAAFEPTSVIYQPCEQRARRRGSFRQGLQAERLFLNHAATHGWIGSMAAHLVMIGGEFLSALPRLCAFSQLAGRLAAWSYRGEIRPARAVSQPAAAATRTGSRIHAADARVVPAPFATSVNAVQNPAAN